MFLLRYLHLGLLLACILPAQADDFILSYWCGPPASENLDQRFAEVAECGFTYAMAPCSGATPEQNKAMLNACQKHGLKYLPIDGRIMAFGPENPAFKTNLDAVISDYGKHPAMGGYFLADEPAPDAFGKLASVNQYLLEQDPKHLPFINLLPNYAPQWALGGTYENYVERFLSTVRPRLLSFDHYALMGNGAERPNYFENLEIIRRVALKHDVPFASIFLVTQHFDYRNPSEADLRWQANTALVYGAKALLYFTYWTPTNDPAFRTATAIIDAKGNRSAHFEDTKRVNASIRKWAPTLMKLNSTEVFHTGKIPAATQPVPENNAVKFTGDGAFILGFFKHDDGSQWLMVMNRDPRQPGVGTLHFEKTTKRLRELSSETGKLSRVGLRNNELAIALPAGGAKLFQISR
jgi:hypothetical protein